eukprot:scaffold131039_cov24-Tisochrysis_lutea.AAC.1
MHTCNVRMHAQNTQPQPTKAAGKGGAAVRRPTPSPSPIRLPVEHRRRFLKPKYSRICACTYTQNAQPKPKKAVGGGTPARQPAAAATTSAVPM